MSLFDFLNKEPDVEKAMKLQVKASQNFQVAIDKFLKTVDTWEIGRGLDDDWDTEQAIQKGLKRNVWVYACCTKVAPDVATIPLTVEKKEGDEWVVDNNHELNDLFKHPSTNRTLKNIIRMGEYHLLLGGNAIVYHPIVSGKPKGMQTLHAGKVRPVPDDKGGYKTYQRKDDGAWQNIKDAPESILHVMYDDPDNPYWGLGRMQAANYVAAASTQAQEWNKNLMDNTVSSNLAFLFKKYLQKEQFTEQVDKISEMYAGAANAGKPIILDNEASIEDLTKTPKEMDFTKSQEQAMYAICSAFGVDPRLIGAKEFSGRAARQEAEKAYWMHTVIPEIQYWTEAMTLYYRQFYDNDIRINYDITNIEALQGEYKEKAETGKDLYDIGVTLDEINRRLELGLETDDIPDSDAPFGGKMRTLNDGPKSKKEQDREMLWKRKDGERRIWENKLVEKFAEGIEKDIDILSNAVSNGEIVSNYKKDITEGWEERLTVSYKALAEYFGDKAFEDMVNQIKSTSPDKTKQFDAEASEMAVWIRKVAREKAVSISDHTIERVREISAQAIEEGKSLSDAAKKVREDTSMWTEIDNSRAMTIARTEVASGIGKANQEARRQVKDEFGWEVKKEWLGVPDSRIRDSHARVDGETVPEDEIFSNGLQYPGDPFGRAEEVINCRCTTKDIVKR